MIFQHDMLLRVFQVKTSKYDFELQCVITKDEFIACYNKWIVNADDKTGGDNND